MINNELVLITAFQFSMNQQASNISRDGNPAIGWESMFYILYTKDIINCFFAQGLPGEKGENNNVAGPKGLPVRRISYRDML
jgi:hypothetical protein